MCADKMRKTMPVRVTFVEGEIPPADKFTTLGDQPRSALTLVEKAIGDIWNQNGDTILANHPLQIANLSRMIGAAGNLNPVVVAPQGQTEFRFYDHIGERYNNLSRGRCLFPIKSGTVPSADGGSINLTNWEVNFEDVDAVGDWHVDSDGNLYVYGKLNNTDVIYYTVAIADMDFDDTYLFNVIPNPDQDAFTGCRISLDGSDYVLHLPPRRPVANHGLDRWLSASEIADSNNTDGATVPYVLYQDTVSGVYHDFYRHPLPKEIRDDLSGLSTGDALPAGFMYLYNSTTQTIIDDVVFTKRASNSEFEIGISSASYDFTSHVSSDETAASYNASPFFLITVGASVTSVLNNLVKAFMTQDSSTRAVLHHGQLDKTNPTYADSNDFEPGPSYVDNDDHVYLLSRFPLTNDALGTDRDPNKNAMLDDLIMGGAGTFDATAGKYVDPSDETTRASTKIFFKGSTTNYPYIYSPTSGNGEDIYLKAEGVVFTDSNSAPTADTLVHVWGGDAGSVLATAGSLLTIEDDVSNAMQFLVPAGLTSSIHFGDENDSDIGGIVYDHSSNQLELRASNSNVLAVRSTGVVIGTNSLAPDNLLHVWGGTAGAVTAVSNSLLVLENDGNCFLQLLSRDGDTNGIYFGSAADNDEGYITFNHSTDVLRIAAPTHKVDILATTLEVSTTEVHVEGSMGIGNTSPQAPLHITSASPTIRMSALAGYAVFAADSDGSVTLASDAGNTASFSTLTLSVDGANSLVIDSADRVGLGKFPNYPLDFDSTILTGGGTGDFAIEGHDDTNTVGAQQNRLLVRVNGTQYAIPIYALT